jgi:hypothetical protein
MSVDILAGILGYVAGIGALVAALAVSFSVFFATQNPPLQTQSQPQNASAMLVRPSTAGAPSRPTAIGAIAKPTANRGNHPEKHAGTGAAAARSPASVRDLHRKSAGGSAQARRLIQEERARRWAYQQDSSQGSSHGSSFESRFLGYAD